MSVESTSISKGVDQSLNARGIPKAPFVENVEEFVKNRDQVESILKSFQDMLQKYKFMELNTAQRIAGLNEKIPDIQKTLETVEFLKSKQDSDETLETQYELNDTLYSKAEIIPTNTVYLWLGANVMLEYSIDEATALLKSKLEAATQSLELCETDLEYLRENITTMEVNTARVYNWDVQKRRLEKETLKTAAVA